MASMAKIKLNKTKNQYSLLRALPEKFEKLIPEWVTWLVLFEREVMITKKVANDCSFSGNNTCNHRNSSNRHISSLNLPPFQKLGWQFRPDSAGFRKKLGFCDRNPPKFWNPEFGIRAVMSSEWLWMHIFSWTESVPAKKNLPPTHPSSHAWQEDIPLTHPLPPSS